MNKALKTKWLKALRGGRYKQGRSFLSREDGTYCCLGVLCRVSGTASKKQMLGLSFPSWAWMQKLKLTKDEDEGRLWKLAYMNDGLHGHRGHTFAEIADHIERNF